jgi:hypothetical protein
LVFLGLAGEDAYKSHTPGGIGGDDYGHHALVKGVDGVALTYLPGILYGKPYDRVFRIGNGGAEASCSLLEALFFEVVPIRSPWTANIWAVMVCNRWSTLHMQEASDVPLWSFSWVLGGTIPPLLGMLLGTTLSRLVKKVLGRLG